MKVGKKLLSVLLSIIMIMTSMSVCFGTFITASAEDVDYTQQLADKLKDSAYADTLALLGKGTKSGSGLNQSTSITFANYKNFKQAAELLRLVDGAMKETASWAKAETFSTEGGTDQSAACNGANTQNVYNDLTANLEKKQVTLDTNVTTFIGFIYHMTGATAHASNNGTSSLGNWKNTVTFSTSDYQGYLAQAGKAANVASSVEMGVQYVVTMQGNLYFEDGCDKKYHHQLWPAGTAINAPSTSATNTEARAKVDAHIGELNSFINMTYAQLLELANAGSIDNKLAEYNTAKSNMVTYVGSQSTYDALFADYAAGIANFLSSVESAKAFQDYMPTVDAWNDFVDANPDYGVFQYPDFDLAGSETQVKLVDDFATFKAYRDYLLTGGSIYTYLVDNYYIDETYYTNFYDNVVAYDLQAVKDKADALYSQYSVAFAAIDGEENVPSLEEKQIVYSTVTGYIDAIDDYSAQVVAAVFTDGYMYLVDFQQAIKCDINEAVRYFAENADKTFVELSTSALWAKIDEAKAKDADLTVLYNDVAANVGAERADQLLSAIRASATNMIENLYKTLADRFALEVNNAWDLYVELGKPTALKVDSFLKLSAVIVSIEPAIYTDLQAAGKAGYIAQETIDRYNELMKVGGIYEIWNAYASTFGFPDYEQTQLKYDDRILMEGDELKTANDAVTEAEMNNLITALDKIITSDLVGDLLGGLLNPDAEPGAEFNLGATLTDLIKGMLFTDDFINTVVKMLYPLVLNEFNKVWATLPDSVEYSGINVKVQYFKNLHTILDEGNFELYPDLLAQKLVDLGYGTKYADNIAMLRAAGGEKDSWESSAIVDYETNKLKLTWGVDEQKAKLDAGEISQAEFDAFFYDAFEHATAGLLPLLTTLITNVAWQPAQVQDIATGNVNIILTVITLNVALQLGSTPNQGYANMLVPIYELLGVPYTPVDQINGSTDVSYVLEQILAPIFTFLNTLGDKPVDTILGILPNLVYALAFRMAKPMLNMLQTKITYDASANLVGSVLADGAEVKVGDMLIGYEEDKMLKEDMFVGGLNSLLANFGLAIPAIDQTTLATLGSLDKIDTSRAAYIYSGLEGTGKAYSITADKADVGYYLLSYLLNAVKDEATLTSLLGLFMTKEVDGVKVPDEEAMAGVKKVIYETLNLDEMNVGNVIAAIVELANQVEYDVGEYYWYDGSKSTPIGTTSATEIYLNPNNDWTEDKADYLYNNLEGLLNAVFSMAKLDLDKTTEEVDGSIEAVLGGLLNEKAFTNETVTKLAKLLGKLDLNALLAGIGGETPDADEPETVAEDEEAEAGLALDINKIIKDELGIDLSVYAQYAEIAEGEEIDFGVTDAASFVAALTELLAPVKPLLDFILGGKDLTLIDSAITLQGYNGYNNAIVPLLEALGATPAAYTDGADTLALTLDALLGLINKLTTNDPAVEKDGAIYTIIDILPGILYYISSNALSQGVDKLLAPVYAILDTIRPIYNVNLAELLAGIEVDFDKDGVKEALGLDLKNIDWTFIFGLLNDLLGLDLSALQQVIYDVSKDIGVTYTSVSTLNSTWKKGAYSDNFSQADMLTVVLSFVLEWATVPANAAKLDELLKTDGIIASLNTVFESVEIAYGTPNWMYWFESEEAFNAYLAGNENIPNTLAALEYPSDNDWNLDTAKYFANNLGKLVDIIIGMINEGKVDENGEALPTTLSALLSDLVNGLVNADMINELVGMITGLLGDIDENLINTAGYLLGVDLDGLKKYECKADINSVSDFINELAKVLDTYAGELVNWLFFGDDYRFAKKSDNSDTIIINGGLGYEKGLAMVLEALGAELPAVANTKSVLGALATRVEAILADPVDEVIGLLPNLVYFLNANGAGVAVSNILAPVYALLDKLATFGLEVDLADLIGIDLANLSLANIVDIVEGATDLPLGAAEAILVNFCTGKITKGEYIYKMEAAKEDVITILLVVALELISDEAFAAKLDEMLGTDFIAGIKEIFQGGIVTYGTPDWNYMNGIETEEGVIEYVNAITSYPNDWTEAKAEYLAANLPALVDAVIKMVEINGVKYDSLAALLQANVNIFTTETLNSLLDMIKDLLGSIDAELLGVGCIIDVDLAGLMAYEVTADITTADAFAAELAKILTTYANGAIEWLLLGRDFKLLVKDNDGIAAGLEGEPYIILNGAQGYTEGLALLLEALGCTNLPTEGTTEEIVAGVLASLAARIDEIFANPVEEVLDLLPNLIYFLDANGVAAVIENTTAALMALVGKLGAFGVELDINSLVNLPELMGIADKYAEGDDVIALNNLTLKALLKAISLMTGLDFTELENVLVPFALGEAVQYDSVSASDAYKMVYKTEYDKHDMISVIVTAALRMFVENEDNAAKLDEMIGTEIISAIKDVFADVEITYATPDWEYPLADNGTVDAMKYSITYPNNWTEETAKYVAAKLPELGDLIAGLIDSNYETLGALLNDKVNVFTTANLQAIADMIAELLGGIDEGLLEAAGVLLGADVVGLKAYTAPEGITTVEAFAAELANILNTYAKGVVEWLLLGEDYTFFVKEVDENGAPVDFITINGAYGYAEGLALLLEALGCTNLPTEGTTEEIVSGVLASLAKRIQAILDAPAAEVVGLLPNLLYFLNANGVAAVVDNTLAAVTALLDKLAVFGLEVDINSLVDLKALMGLEDTDAAISLDNLSMGAVLEAVGLMVGLDLTLIEDVLVGFGLGQVLGYTSVSGKTAYIMTYYDEYDVYDMVTVLVNLVVLTITDEKNAEFVKGLVGDDAYAIIDTLCNKGVIPADIQDFEWKFTDRADTDYVFSALATSEIYSTGKYGPLYTEEMAQYIADNFGEFVDNILYLLGLEINGSNVNDLKDLINGLLNGSLYNSANVIAIRDALAGALAGIADLEVNGKNVGGYIVEVLAKAEIADFAAIAAVEIPEFSESREMFTEYLCDVLEPLYPVLKFVLAKGDFAFFVDTELEAAIKLQGGEGYAYGILPLLEVLECENILAPDAYYAAVEANGDVLLTSILNPLLDRVDAILAEDPAGEILDMLPNIIYFINSNGVDTVVKNTLHAVYGLLSAIAPIAEIDLYELIGIDLADINFEWLFNKLLEIIASATGYEFDALDASAILELTVGTLESYTSLNGETAYKMVYANHEDIQGGKAEMVTVVMRLIVTFIMHENNREMLLGLLRDNLGMSEDAEKYVRGILDTLATISVQTYLGMDQALATLYYLFYGADLGVGGAVSGLKDLNAEWQKILKELGKSDDPNEMTIGNLLAKFLNKYMDDVLTEDGVAPNGFIAFFQKIIDWFNKIIEWFKNLFN